MAALLDRGMTNRQIAVEVLSSDRTAGTRVAHVLDKLSFAARA